MLGSIRKIGAICLMAFIFPFVVMAEEEMGRISEKPAVPDSILNNIFQFSPFYSRIVDEYKADLYIKGRVKVHKSNKLVRYIPSMFRCTNKFQPEIYTDLTLKRQNLKNLKRINNI